MHRSAFRRLGRRFGRACSTTEPGPGTNGRGSYAASVRSPVGSTLVEPPQPVQHHRGRFGATGVQRTHPGGKFTSASRRSNSGFLVELVDVCQPVLLQESEVVIEHIGLALVERGEVGLVVELGDLGVLA